MYMFINVHVSHEANEIYFSFIVSILRNTGDHELSGGGTFFLGSRQFWSW